MQPSRLRSLPRSSSRGRFLRVLACVGLALSWLSACQRSESARAARETELVVFAAASLRDAFGELAKSFEQSHPGTHVTFNFAGTQELRTQLEQGAQVDVFASADQKHMSELASAGLVSTPVVFAKNEPVVVVAKESSAQIRAFADIAHADRIVIGAPEVPIGRYTLQILQRAAASFGADFRARVEANVVSRELNVRQALAKISLGEAQVAFVYNSDAIAAREHVSVVRIPSEVNVIAEYPIALVSSALHPKLGAAWVELATSAAAKTVLERAGFLPNSATGTKS